MTIETKTFNLVAILAGVSVTAFIVTASYGFMFDKIDWKEYALIMSTICGWTLGWVTKGLSVTLAAPTVPKQ